MLLKGEEEGDEYPEYQDPLYAEEDTYHASAHEWCNNEGEWEPEGPEGYDDEDAAYEEDDDEADQEDAEEVDGSVTQ
eukprot:12898838-Prorocentrum_lima.AAC.1